MIVDLVAAEAWERASQRIQQILAPPARQTVRVHPGLGPAVTEVALSWAQIFSHKRSIAFVKGNSPSADHALTWFSKEGYQLQSLFWSQLKTEEDARRWVGELAKDTVMMVMAEDHPLTGERAPVSWLEGELTQRKILSLRVSHGSASWDRAPLGPQTIRVAAVDPGLAFSQSGVVTRWPPLFSHRFPWVEEDVVARLRRVLGRTCDAAAVAAVEARFPAQRFFTADAARWGDRAVLVFDDIGGEALLRDLQTRGHLGEIGWDGDTAHLCRWNSLSVLKGWWESAPSPERLRGLVVFSAERCRQPGFADQLAASAGALRARQVW